MNNEKTQEDVVLKRLKKDREYRSYSSISYREENNELIVEGYAIVFNNPTVLYEYDGIKYYEQVDRKALDKADISDVIMLYNHDGKVVARIRNNTLKLETDDYGCKITAVLGGTQEGRNLYEEIKGGYIDQMSFGFTIDEYSYDSNSRTTTILSIKKLYDVSAVSIPAYPTTTLSARSLDLIELEHSKELALVEAKNDQRRKLEFKKKKALWLLENNERKKVS